MLWLLDQLLATAQVPERAGDGGSTLRDDVGHAAPGADLGGQILEDLMDLRPLLVGAVAHLGTQQVVQEEIAIVLVRGRALESQDRLEPETGSDGGDGAAAVGLKGAAGD